MPVEEVPQKEHFTELCYSGL